jgi:hypothetical protein
MKPEEKLAEWSEGWVADGLYLKQVLLDGKAFP